jgi:hypothetical protein
MTTKQSKSNETLQGVNAVSQPVVGWVVRPLGGESTLFMSRVEDTQSLTPEVLQAIERDMASFKAKMTMDQDCPKLGKCGSFQGTCPSLVHCGTYL